MHDFEQVRTRIALDVELHPFASRSKLCRDRSHIGRTDVPLVGARMHGDAVRTRRHARPNRV